MITPAFAITATERILPKLALNFTSATLDSRVTFTRTTGVSNPATFVNSGGVITAATNNQPRFDYDPTTLVCKGLLIEESRTNLALQSAAMNTSPWVTTVAGAGTISSTANYASSPDGTSTATRYQMSLNGSTSTSSISSFVQAINVVSGTVYTISVWLKTNDGSTATLIMRDDRANIVNTNFQVNGTWTRYTFSGTATSTIDANFKIWLRGGLGTSNSVDLLTWGAQMEAGAFATSYIPTTTTALTRNADVATMTGANFSDWYSSGVGGLSVGAIAKSVSGIKPSIQFDDTTVNELIVLRGNTTNPELYIADGGAAQVQIDAGTIAANTAYNLTGAWATNSCAASVNGGAAVTDASATMPTVTQARLGCDGTNYLNGWLQTVRYWPQRITNAETQAFSK